MKIKKLQKLAFILIIITLSTTLAIGGDEKPLAIDWPALVPPEMTRALARQGTILDENIKFGMRYDPAFFPLVEELAGKRIRMAAFALPLEYENTTVKEFLMVPYIGACIHMPPPMPNQIIYATSEEGYVGETLYTPLWITGTLHTKVGEFNLSFVDGSENVTVGYYLEVDTIEPLIPGSGVK